MKPEEKKVARLREQQYKRHQKEREEMKAAVTALKEVGCSHPKEHCDVYPWEHDNGYGRQTKMTGWVCLLCGARDLWSRGFSSWSES